MFLGAALTGREVLDALELEAAAAGARRRDGVVAHELVDLLGDEGPEGVGLGVLVGGVRRAPGAGETVRLVGCRPDGRRGLALGEAGVGC